MTMNETLAQYDRLAPLLINLALECAVEKMKNNCSDKMSTV